METNVHLRGTTADRERKGQLVPVLLRITAEPESAYERFYALAHYALGTTCRMSSESRPILKRSKKLLAKESLSTNRVFNQVCNNS